MQVRSSFFQISWLALLTGILTTIVLVSGVYNIFHLLQQSHGEEFGLNIIFYCLLIGFLVAVITAYSFYFKHKRLSQFTSNLNRVLYDLNNRTKQDLPQIIPYWFPEGESLLRNLDILSQNYEKELQILEDTLAEKKTIFSLLSEGFIAVDLNRNVIDINQAACDLFQVTQLGAKNKDLDSLIRHTGLLNLVKDVLVSGRAAGSDIELLKETTLTYVRVHCKPLMRRININSAADRLDSKNFCKLVKEEKTGVLINLCDIGQLQRLETIRRDFVANVSHELKTPISSIKGAAETLIDGNVVDQEIYLQFINIIARQADRLNTLVESLLTLSTVEHDQYTNVDHLELTSINNLIQRVILTMEQSTSSKNIKIKFEKCDHVDAVINPFLLERALINLVENAVKYSDPESVIVLSMERQSEKFIINVQDTGLGIEKKYLERIFERFYRVDPARSREVGGTGLGLSIVKHIVEGHKGVISVFSRRGEGSTFSVQIPFATQTESQTHGNKIRILTSCR